MDLHSATALALIYKEVSESDYNKYLTLLTFLESKTDILSAKSLRFENQHTKIAPIEKCNDECFTFQNPCGNGEIKVYQYRIKSFNKEKNADEFEKGFRYAIYAEDLPVIFSLRAFDNKKAYDKLLRSPSINVQFTVEFKGATITKYTFNSSDVERFAVFCEDNITFTEADFIEAKNKLKLVHNAVRTTVFGDKT